MVEITKEIRDAAQAEFDRWDTASGMGPSAEKPWQIVRLCNQGGAPDFIHDEVGWTIKGEYTSISKASAALMAMRLEAILAAVAPLIEAAVRAEGWRLISEAPRDGTEILGTDGENTHVCYPKRFSTIVWEYFRDGENAPGHTWSFKPSHFMALPAPPRSAP